MGYYDIIVYRYGSICEPDVISAFQTLGMTVHEVTVEITEKNQMPSYKMRHLLALLQNTDLRFEFVFSINFFPYVSELCNKLNTVYLSWIVDCPVTELFSVAIKNQNNRIFVFDRTQYQRIQSYNPDRIFYLPLATNVERWDKQLDSITEEDKKTYSADVSFVGSLYHEKSPLSILRKNEILNEYWEGYIQGICEAQLKIYGYNFLEEVIPDTLIERLKQKYKNMISCQNMIGDIERYIVANDFVGMRVSEQERIQTLNEIAKEQSVVLYTRSNTNLLKKVDCRPGVTTHEQMPRIFNLSKINLNITMKSIQSGLSLRVWDILGCSGFCLSNYQSEISDFFEIGKDLECYESIEECKEKIAFYLAHEDLRKEISEHGYEKVRTLHTYEKRIACMFRYLTRGVEDC